MSAITSTPSIIFLGIQPAQGQMVTYSQLVTIIPEIQSNPPITYIINLLVTSEGAAARAFRQIQLPGQINIYWAGTSDYPSSASDQYDQDVNNFQDLGGLAQILNGNDMTEHHYISPAPASLALTEFLQCKRLHFGTPVFVVYLTASDNMVSGNFIFTTTDV
jgi:hypothetical protein